MIQLNIPYSQSDLCKELGITTQTFIRRREDYIESLKLAYDFVIDDSKSNRITYVFVKQLDEWSKPLSKTKKEEKKAYIKEYIQQLIIEEPLQTASNISRLLKNNRKLNLSESTTRQYTSECLKEMFGKKVNERGSAGYIARKVWAHLDKARNKYIPIPKEEIDNYIQMIKHHDELIRERDSEIFNDYKAGIISRKELCEILGESGINKFEAAMSDFRETYGYNPLKVPEYKLDENYVLTEEDYAAAGIEM